MVDLSLVIHSASTLTPYDHSIDKSLPSTPDPSSIPSLVENRPAEDEIVISPIDPALMPLESPSRFSAIASSHNSLESNFDPSQHVLSPDAWPRTPTTIPVRLPCRSFNVGYVPKQESRFDVAVNVPLPKSAAHVRSCTADIWTKRLPGCGMEKRQGIYVTMVKETQ